MDKLVIQGGRALKGQVAISGAKNAALPIMAAALMAEGKTVLHHVPDLKDIATMAEILKELGMEVARNGQDLTLEVKSDSSCRARYELVSTMRASVCVLGPLLARRKRAELSLPGGCVIGVRPIDLHLKGLTRLGVDISIRHGYVHARTDGMKGARIYLGGSFGSSVTGTENMLMAAALAEGVTTIENAACEPEVQELAQFLNAMGADISGIGSHRLVVHGVRALKGVEYTIIPDRIETGTFMVAAAITHGDLTITHVSPEHSDAVIDTLSRIGVEVEVGPDWCRVRPGGELKPTDITTLPYPGFPTDMQAQFLSLLSLADGISIVTEKIYPDRFMHIAELSRMGAQIRKEGNSAIIQGTEQLHGAPVMASDLRASAALVLAGLAADGTTEVTRVYHIDRGYERIEEKLKPLGAAIQREVDKKLIVVNE